jgi:hypothetical protein
MGGNGTVHSSLFNPALLALQTQKDVRVDYYNKYSLRELATISGGFCFPNEALPVGLHLASFGYDEYRESMFRLSVGKRLNSYWSLGIGVQYALLQSDLYEEDASRLSTDIGITLQPVENWLIALSIINLPSISINNENTDTKHITPYLLGLGFNWAFTNDLLITGGLAHGKEQFFSGSMGIEYAPFTDFQFRLGLKTAPFCPSVGVGYRFSGLQADVVMIYHPVLGSSTGIGLSYSF